MDKEKASIYDRSIIRYYKILRRLNKNNRYISFAKIGRSGERLEANEDFVTTYMNNREKREQNFNRAVYRYERDIYDAIKEEGRKKLKKAGLLDLVTEFRFK